MFLKIVEESALKLHLVERRGGGGGGGGKEGELG